MTEIFQNFSMELVEIQTMFNLIIFTIYNFTSGKQGSHVRDYGYPCFTHAMFNVLYRHTILDKGQGAADRNYRYRTCNRCYGAYISQVLNCYLE